MCNYKFQKIKDFYRQRQSAFIDDLTREKKGKNKK